MTGCLSTKPRQMDISKHRLNSESITSQRQIK